MPAEPWWWTAALVGEAKIIAPKHAAESRKFPKFIATSLRIVSLFVRPREAKYPRFPKRPAYADSSNR
jgi:hypothetical protein